jgi:NADPH:quinone reductase-like Zn-dependent oxidoreductase
MAKVINAIRFHDYGGPEVMKVEAVPCPAPKADEVLVRVHAMGVNPVDWKIREGLARKRINIPLPATPGGDISGVIEEAGSSVQGLRAGDAVYALIGLMGAYAEAVAVKAEHVAHKPKSMDHVHAASVPLAALTAWQALFDHGGLQRGQRVLVHAAAGGVGGFAVQLARNAGADVVGTASAANADYVRSLGASQVIDYHENDFGQFAAQFDLVFDLIGGETGLRSLPLLKKGGIYVGSMAPAESLTQQASAAGIRTTGMQVRPDGKQLREIAALIDAGKVASSIAATFVFADAGKAHALSKTGHTRGKIVLTNKI